MRRGSEQPPRSEIASGDFKQPLNRHNAKNDAQVRTVMGMQGPRPCPPEAKKRPPEAKSARRRQKRPPEAKPSGQHPHRAQHGFEQHAAIAAAVGGFDHAFGVGHHAQHIAGFVQHAGDIAL